jgi:hypothetical protein
MPDFEGVVAERKALERAFGFPHFTLTLSFLIAWKELRYAARLVLERSREVDGSLYFVLDPAARALEGKQPLAAALLCRGDDRGHAGAPSLGLGPLNAMQITEVLVKDGRLRNAA